MSATEEIAPTPVWPTSPPPPRHPNQGGQGMVGNPIPIWVGEIEFFLVATEESGWLGGCPAKRSGNGSADYSLSALPEAGYWRMVQRRVAGGGGPGGAPAG